MILTQSHVHNKNKQKTKLKLKFKKVYVTRQNNSYAGNKYKTILIAWREETYASQSATEYRS